MVPRRTACLPIPAQEKIKIRKEFKNSIDAQNVLFQKELQNLSKQMQEDIKNNQKNSEIKESNLAKFNIVLTFWISFFKLHIQIWPLNPNFRCFLYTFQLC